MMTKPLNRQTAGKPLLYPERIVQFGGGNFLRGFIDWIVEVLNEQTDFASSIVIIKPTPGGSYQDFDRQDGLFHVQLHGLQGGEPVTERKLITCVSRTINPYQTYDEYLKLAHQPEIRFIISNTTEAGITFDEAAQLEDRPAKAFPAKLTAFLLERYRHFEGKQEAGCIIMPCELIEQNGEQLQQIMLQYADLWQLEAGFAEWIKTACLFCNTLVDRIVPGSPPAEDAAQYFQETGFEDALWTEGELYHSLVIEAPEWLHDELPVRQTGLNVKIVPDVRPYREMKVRILNGAHTAMTPTGLLAGIETVREVVQHPILGQFIHDLVFQEILPSMTLPEAETRPFAEATLARFQNPFIHHRLQSIALQSLTKFRVRLIPSLLTFQERYHHLPANIGFALAALIQFYQGEWHGQPLPLNDDPSKIDWFRSLWQSGMATRDLVTAVLKNPDLWGTETDLTEIPELAEQVTMYLDQIKHADSLLTVIETSGQIKQ